MVGLSNGPIPDPPRPEPPKAGGRKVSQIAAEYLEIDENVDRARLITFSGSEVIPWLSHSFRQAPSEWAQIEPYVWSSSGLITILEMT